MYYVIRTNSEWKGKVLHAEIESHPRRPMQNPTWWGNDPIFEPDLEFQFQIEPQKSYPDSLWTATEYDLYSAKLLSIFSEFKIGYEVYKTKIKDKVDGKTLNIPYQVVRLLELHSAIDEKLSVYRKVEFHSMDIFRLQKVVLLKEFKERNICLTRIKDHLNLVIVSQKFKNVLEDRNISGFYFVPIDEYST